MARRDSGRPWTLVFVVFASLLTLSGCGAIVERGFLPEPITTEGPAITDFWNATWIAALAVGVLVWGLILWCMVAYRRRSADQPLPPQIRYNVPLEILYTVVPLLMVAVLFGKTVQLESDMLDTTESSCVFFQSWEVEALVRKSGRTCRI